MIDHKICPQCKIEWHHRPVFIDNYEQEYECVNQCGLILRKYPVLRNFPEEYLIHKTVGDFQVWWEVIDNPFPCEITQTTRGIILRIESIIPFDITPDQIEIYLTFS